MMILISKESQVDPSEVVLKSQINQSEVSPGKGRREMELCPQSSSRSKRSHLSKNSVTRTRLFRPLSWQPCKRTAGTTKAIDYKLG